MNKYMLLLILLIIGCKAPESAYSRWEVNVFSANGTLFETYYVKSVDHPVIHKESMLSHRLEVYTLNTLGYGLDPMCEYTGINIPATWQIKIRKLK